MKSFKLLPVLLVGAFIGLFLGGCAHEQSTKEASAPTVPTQAEPVAKNVAAETNAALVTEVSFVKGSSQLSANAKRKLEQLVIEAKSRGKIDDIKVIAWSDINYPSEVRGSLSNQQRTLASNRNREVEKYIKNVSETSLSVDTFNMAERPNTFEKWFNTSDYKVKKSLEDAGLPTTANGTLSLPDKRSSAMVLVVLE